MKILKFTASWCQPCRHMDNVIFDLPEDKRNMIKSIDVESEEGIDLSEKYKIRSVPTIIFLDDNNNELFRNIGLMTRSLLETTIDEYYGLTKNDTRSDKEK